MKSAEARSSHGVTDYSPEIPGRRENHDRPVVFDYTDGYIGILAYETPKPKTGKRQDYRCERVLLSPEQFAALVEFVNSKHPRQPR